MLSLRCNCGVVFQLPIQGTFIFLFPEEEYNNVQSVCPHCGRRAVLFFDDPDILMMGYTLVEMDEVPEEVKQLYAAINALEEKLSEDKPKLPYKELSPRMEKELDQLHEVLENTPDDLLMDLFSNPPPKSDRPKEW